MPSLKQSLKLGLTGRLFQCEGSGQSADHAERVNPCGLRRVPVAPALSQATLRERGVVSRAFSSARATRRAGRESWPGTRGPARTSTRCAPVRCCTTGTAARERTCRTASSPPGSRCMSWSTQIGLPSQPAHGTSRRRSSGQESAELLLCQAVAPQLVGRLGRLGWLAVSSVLRDGGDVFAEVVLQGTAPPSRI
jgi:hypothetical protein